jgi:transposase-like protein
MADYTETVVINGEECDYDPAAQMARMYCDSCGQPNEVPAFREEDGSVDFQGFVCEHCGAFNAPR